MTTPVPQQAKSWALKNPVVVVSGLSVFIAGMKVLSVSGGDAEVLKTLVQTLDIPSLVTATILPLMPNLVVIGLLMFVDNQLSKDKEERLPHPDWALSALSIIVVSLMFFVPIIILIIYILYFISIQVRRYSAKRKGLILTNVSIIPMILPPIIMAVVSSSSIWLPQENIEFSSGEKRSAFVLSSDVRWTTILLYKDTTQTLPTSEIVSRQSCTKINSDGILSRSLASFTKGKRTDLPHCIEPDTTASSSTENPEGSDVMGSDTIKWVIAALIFAALAFIISAFAWVRAGTSDERDKKAWRLTRIQEDVADLINSSETRNRLCQSEGDFQTGLQSEEMMKELDKLSTLNLKLQSANDGEITKFANSVVSLHQRSNDSFREIKAGYIKTERGTKVQTISDNRLAILQDRARMHQHTLDTMHAALMMATRNELGLKPNSVNLLPNAPKSQTPKEENPKKTKSDSVK
ncbi:hypothetical protein [Rhodococcus sp. NPDC060176]|uniref:hypothetical protein n=1 Tax=Rhodococcus sp. NPDC060176 TaxID=3347062 RepID=UPI00364D7810